MNADVTTPSETAAAEPAAPRAKTILAEKKKGAAK